MPGLQFHEDGCSVNNCVWREQGVLRGHLLWVSDVALSLLLMLQGLLSISETSESIAGRLHLVCTAASVEGISLDVAPNDKVSLHVEFGRCHVLFNLCSPSHSEDVYPTALSTRPACTINNMALEAASEMQQPPRAKIWPTKLRLLKSGTEWYRTGQKALYFPLINKKVPI